uniref:Uncharacterized protein n=1 Tax=Arundo donax TaxID=35708 RepID=A0A0A9B927_ARUDO
MVTIVVAKHLRCDRFSLFLNIKLQAPEHCRCILPILHKCSGVS